MKAATVVGGAIGALGIAALIVGLTRKPKQATGSVSPSTGPAQITFQAYPAGTQQVQQGGNLVLDTSTGGALSFRLTNTSAQAQTFTVTAALSGPVSGTWYLGSATYQGATTSVPGVAQSPPIPLPPGEYMDLAWGVVFQDAQPDYAGTYASVVHVTAGGQTQTFTVPGTFQVIVLPPAPGSTSGSGPASGSSGGSTGGTSTMPSVDCSSIVAEMNNQVQQANANAQQMLAIAQGCNAQYPNDPEAAQSCYVNNATVQRLSQVNAGLQQDYAKLANQLMQLQLNGQCLDANALPME